MANKTYVTICPVEDVPEGHREVFDVNGRWVAIFCVSGRYYAIEDVCTHDGQSLTQDRQGNEVPLEGYEIACPRHGARFDIRTGAVLTPPALQNVRRYEVRVHEGQIELLV
jgi:3-phenylpropionate/trans-cinnamate dioxygenase ferredoxin subunit